MKIACTSDWHGHLPEIPECDLLLIAGDITPVWDHNRKYQADWLRNEFSNHIDESPALYIVWVGGNHDFVLQSGNCAKLAKQVGQVFLDNESVEVNGLKIWGSPMSNRFGNWANMAEEYELESIYRNIPGDIDILITHGPAYGVGDKVGEKWRMAGVDPHVGSKSLARQLDWEDWPNLQLHLFGHIHGDAGMHEDFSWYSVNGSLVDENYDPVNPIIVLEV